MSREKSSYKLENTKTNNSRFRGGVDQIIKTSIGNKTNKMSTSRISRLFELLFLIVRSCREKIEKETKKMAIITPIKLKNLKTKQKTSKTYY